MRWFMVAAVAFRMDYYHDRLTCLLLLMAYTVMEAVLPTGLSKIFVTHTTHHETSSSIASV